ncbi:MAG: hypothetical protein HWE34_11935 [Methylocystaceae bacterium]|nr:hypothetical protein [Methylocystaceae bacterium]
MKKILLIIGIIYFSSIDISYSSDDIKGYMRPFGIALGEKLPHAIMDLTDTIINGRVYLKNFPNPPSIIQGKECFLNDISTSKDYRGDFSCRISASANTIDKRIRRIDIAAFGISVDSSEYIINLASALKQKYPDLTCKFPDGSINNNKETCQWDWPNVDRVAFGFASNEHKGFSMQLFARKGLVDMSFIDRDVEKTDGMLGVEEDAKRDVDGL